VTTALKPRNAAENEIKTLLTFCPYLASYTRGSCCETVVAL